MGNRLTIAVNLVYGQDDDLLAWINEIERGQRDPMIKAALRHALASGEEIRLPTSNGHGDPALNQRIAELEAIVAHLSKRVEGLWSPFDYFPESQVESMPALSDEEQQERAVKLKKANW